MDNTIVSKLTKEEEVWLKAYSLAYIPRQHLEPQFEADRTLRLFLERFSSTENKEEKLELIID